MEIDMLTGGEMLYSKRYEMLDFPHDEDSGVRNAWVEDSLEKLWRKIREESILVQKPEQCEKSEQFVALAKVFSETYEVDMDIIRRSYFIDVRIHMYCGAYPRSFTRYFADLVNMCDRIHTFIQKDAPNDFSICLEYDTHDYYISGKRFNDA